MRHNIIRLTAVTTALSLAICVSPSLAAAAPGRHKTPGEDGSVPKKWDQPTPAVATDDSTPTAAGGVGDGTNDISFRYFDDGDMVCGLPGGTLTGHAGIWSDARHTSDYAKCVWSANTTPVNGVQLEPAVKYRTYDFAYGLWVPTKYTYGSSVIAWCAAQAGEPYDISSSKTDYARWYCSKLAWAGWKARTGIDLDADGGYWVKPADLVNDSQTSTFASGN